MKYAYGNGSYGCVFDHVAGPFDTLADAVDAAVSSFDDVFVSEQSRALAHKTLTRDGSYHFGSRRHTAGADYVEVFEVPANWTAEGEE